VRVAPGFRLALRASGMTAVGFTNTKSSTALRHGEMLSLWALMEGPGTRDAPRELAWLIAQLYR